METEWKIGEIRQVNGEWYQCVENEDYPLICKSCSFYNERYDLCEQKIQKCTDYLRSDGKTVIFKRLEKVGEPFTVDVGGLNVWYQRYSLPFSSEVTLEGSWYRTIDKFIDIGIKENKEDMGDNDIKPYDKFFSEGTVSNTEHLSKSNLKPFDLQKAKDGKPVCTRDGRKARIICFDAKCNKPIVALIYDCNKETVLQYLENGRFFVDQIDKYDLMMLPEKKEGWVNVYKSYNVGKKIPCMASIYPTKEEAKKSSVVGFDYVDTVKIEWEE